MRFVLTLHNGRYKLWRSDHVASPAFSAWQFLATVPGPAISYAPGGVPGSFVTWSSPVGGFDILAGSADGNLYYLWWGEGAAATWQLSHSFGAGYYTAADNRRFVPG
jgi:hypothetical protein